MSVGFSIFKNIDFTNTDNLIFLSIFLVIVVIVLSVLFVVITKIIKAIAKFFARAGSVNPKLNQKLSRNWLHQSQIIKEAGGISTDPRTRIVGGDYIKSSNVGEKRPVEKQKNAVKSYKEKEEKGILEHLGKLKTDQGEKKETLESKMPSRSENQPKNVGRERIKIPTSKHF